MFSEKPQHLTQPSVEKTRFLLCLALVLNWCARDLLPGTIRRCHVQIAMCGGSKWSWSLKEKLGTYRIIQTQIHACSHCLNTCRHWMNIDRWIGTHCISCISLVSLVSYVSYHVSCNEPISSRFIVFGSNTSEFDPSLSQPVLRSLAPDVLSQPRRSKTKSHCRHPPGTNEKLTKQPTPKNLQ